MNNVVLFVLRRLEQDRKKPQKMSVTERPFSSSLRSSQPAGIWRKLFDIESVEAVDVVQRSSCQGWV